MSVVKNYLKKIHFLVLLKKAINNLLIELNWRREGRPSPPPHLIKRRVVKSYAKKYSLFTFIETGTYQGEMVDAMKNVCQNIYSIELSEMLYNQAKIKLSGVPNVNLIHGDSSIKLKELLININDRCLFWLDGHYSGGETAKSDIETPIMEELKIIFTHSVTGHIVLIDDARCFIGQNDYPTIDEIRSYVFQHQPKCIFKVKDDIIRILQK